MANKQAPKSFSEYFQAFIEDPMSFIQTYPMYFIGGLIGIAMIMKRFMPRLYRKLSNIF